MVRVYWDILLDLDIVDCLQDCESVTNADDAHLLQLFVP